MKEKGRSSMNKNNWQQFRILICLSLFAWAAFTNATSQSEVVKVIVGGQQILIPAPDSFFQATSRRIIQIGEFSTIKEDRLVAVFATTSDINEEAKGGKFRMGRYGLVAASRNVEPYQIPLGRFAKYKADTKAQAINGLTPDERADVQKNSERFYKWYEANMGSQLQIDVPRVGAISILDETPTSLTMVTRLSFPMSINGGAKQSVEMIEGISQVLVKSKVIWLQLNAPSKSRDDFDWVAKNIVKCARAVNAANP
jgi:hypothetical protein